MKLNELYNVISENETIWVNASGTSVCYDGKNSIDESFNNLDVKCITVGGDGFLTIEVRDIREDVQDVINNLGESEYIEVWNNYCDAVDWVDDKIYYIDEFDDMFCDKDPLEIARIVIGTGFNPNDYYFKTDGYGDVTSDDYPSSLVSDEDALINYIIEHDDELGNHDLRDALGK